MSLRLGHFQAIDVMALGCYLIVAIVLGVESSYKGRQASDFLNASRSQPSWRVSLSFLAANIGALEILGVSATAMEYGAKAFNFYWIGAVPALVCLSLFIIPVYRKSGVRSIPDYLSRRFDEKTRVLNAFLSLVLVVFLSGISLNAIETVLAIACGWPAGVSGSIALTTVAIYTLLGGLRATIYNEAFQILVILAGLAPLGWWLLRPSAGVLASLHRLPGGQSHMWQGLKWFAPSAPLDGFGTVAGLGFVLGFGYWCTDFVLIQRVLSVKDAEAARQVPLWAGFGKLAFGFLLVVPGLFAILRPHASGSADSGVIPQLIVSTYRHGWLGLGITALLASLMANLAANVSACSALWTEELYRPYLNPSASSTHYRRVGRITTILALLCSALAAVSASHFSNLMEYIQLLFSVFAAPVFGLTLAGMFLPRIARSAGFWALLAGFSVSMSHLSLYEGGWIGYGSVLNANFHCAIYAWVATVFTLLLLSIRSWHTEEDRPDPNLLFRREAFLAHSFAPLLLALALSSACLVLTFLWW